jgi:hypothetical protein
MMNSNHYSSGLLQCNLSQYPEMQDDSQTDGPTVGTTHSAPSSRTASLAGSPRPVQDNIFCDEENSSNTARRRDYEEGPFTWREHVDIDYNSRQRLRSSPTAGRPVIHREPLIDRRCRPTFPGTWSRGSWIMDHGWVPCNDQQERQPMSTFANGSPTDPPTYDQRYGPSNDRESDAQRTGTWSTTATVGSVYAESLSSAEDSVESSDDVQDNMPPQESERLLPHNHFFSHPTPRRFNDSLQVSPYQFPSAITPLDRHHRNLLESSRHTGPHRHFHGPLGLNRPIPAPRPVRHTCPFCNEEFQRNSSLRSHLRSCNQPPGTSAHHRRTITAPSPTAQHACRL